MCPTRHRRVWVARQAQSRDETLGRALGRLRRFVATGDALAALEQMSAVVPEFVPSADALARARAQSLQVRQASPARVARTA